MITARDVRGLSILRRSISPTDFGFPVKTVLLERDSPVV